MARDIDKIYTCFVDWDGEQIEVKYRWDDPDPSVGYGGGADIVDFNPKLEDIDVDVLHCEAEQNYADYLERLSDVYWYR